MKFAVRDANGGAMARSRPNLFRGSPCRHLPGVLPIVSIRNLHTHPTVTPKGRGKVELIPSGAEFRYMCLGVNDPDRGLHGAQLSRNERSFLLRLGCLSLRSAFASIWRMRSRVTENC